MFIKIKKLNYKGEGIGYSSRDIFRFSNVLVGEVVNAKTDEIVKRSKYRIMPICKYYYTCSGCNFQIADYNHQIKMKFKFLRSTLSKFDFNPLIHQFETSNTFNYLNIYERNYYNIKVDSCPLLYDEINEILKLLPNSLIIRGSKRLKSFLVVVDYQRGLNRDYFVDVYNSSSFISGIIFKRDKKYRRIVGDFEYKEKILNKTIRISAFSDFDENIEIFEKKVKFLKDFIRLNKIKKALIIKSEFYPIFLFEQLDYIIAVERNAYNRRDLDELVKIYDVFNCQILSVKPSTAIEVISEVELIILNKPFLRHIKSLKGKNFKYVIVILNELGILKRILEYMKALNCELLEVKLFDSYPQIFKFDVILIFRK